MDLNERYQGVDVGRLWTDGLIPIGYQKMSRDDIFAHIERSNKKYPAKYIENLKKMSEGIEEGWLCEINNFTIIVWTSWMPSKKRFKKNDRVWPAVILDPRNEDPFWAIPLNRVGDFIGRTITTARIYKEKVIHWPHCPECKKMLFWQELFTYSDSEQEIANEQFPLRYVVCRNPKCSKSYEKPTMLITDIVLPDEKDNVFFAAPFKRYAKKRARDIANNIFTISRRLWSWLHKHGITVHRRRPYDDLENEMRGYSDYNDLRYENMPDNYIDVLPSPMQ